MAHEDCRIPLEGASDIELFDRLQHDGGEIVEISMAGSGVNAVTRNVRIPAPKNHHLRVWRITF